MRDPNVIAASVQYQSALHFADDYRELTPPDGCSGTARRLANPAGTSAALEIPQIAAEYERADEQVCHEIAHHMNKQPLPPLIIRFLEQHWRSYLVQVYILDGMLSRRWRDALQTIDQLTWSLQPKRDGESRHELFAMLPELNQQLRAGLKTVDLDAAEEDVFFGELAKLHVRALNPGTPLCNASAPSDAQESSGRMTCIPKSSQASHSKGDSVRMRGRRRSPALPKRRSQSTRPHFGETLTLGMSMEFCDQRSTPRHLRLTWMSATRGVFMFTDCNRGDLICLTASRLEQCVLDGSAQFTNK